MSSKNLTYIPTPLASSASFNNGDVVCVNSSGLAVAPADTANLVMHGLCGDDSIAYDANNTSKTMKVVPIASDRYQVLTLTGASQASVGKTVYWTGASTVATSSSNSVKAGIVRQFLSTNTVLVELSN